MIGYGCNYWGVQLMQLDKVTKRDTLPLFEKAATDKLQIEVGHEAATRLISSLISELQDGIAALYGFMTARDLHMLETKAHALKSAARSFGAMKLGDLCRQMEMAAKDGALTDDLQRLYQQLQACTGETILMIEEATALAE